MTIAAALVAADLALQRGLASWDGTGKVPPAVARPALHLQKLELRLTDDERLAQSVLPRLPPRLARDLADDLEARRELIRLTPPRPLAAFRVGPARPAAELRNFYLEAEQRTSVPWQVLAAVNYGESDFGRMRETSVAGAQGPMQFIAATWAAYGRGDVHDPRAAILGAARFLRAAGALASLRGALYRYNPSAAYVDAILRYTRRIRRDPAAFLAFYARQVIVRTPSGYRRLTHFGLGSG